MCILIRACASVLSRKRLYAPALCNSWVVSASRTRFVSLMDSSLIAFRAVSDKLSGASASRSSSSFSTSEMMSSRQIIQPHAAAAHLHLPRWQRLGAPLARLLDVFTGRFTKYFAFGDDSFQQLQFLTAFGALWAVRLHFHRGQRGDGRGLFCHH